MFKKVLLLALCLLPFSTDLKASAQSRAQSSIQVSSATRQANGRLQLQLTESWSEGVSFNMVFVTIKDFSCQDRTGVITFVQGNIGIETFAEPVNEPKAFPIENAYGRAIAPLCQSSKS